jgi:signal transduction histidine kinase
VESQVGIGTTFDVRLPKTPIVRSASSSYVLQ